MPEFSEILRRARAGDAEAVAHLYVVSRYRVEAIARRGIGARLQPKLDTADVAQSVFTDMLRELPGFEDRGEPAFRAWLAAKVRHKLATEGRRLTLADGSAREESLDASAGAETPATEPDPGEAAGLRDDEARIASLLGTLEPAQRAVIGLHLDERLGWDEVARRVGLQSAAAARMRYVRALAVLRERWTRGRL